MDPVHSTACFKSVFRLILALGHLLGESLCVHAKRNQFRRCLGIAAAQFFLAGSLFSVFAQSEQPSGLKIAGTIFPLSDVAKQVAGEQSEVRTLLPAGANPHTFELSPAAVKELQGVRIVFAIGHGFDDWVHASVDHVEGLETFKVDQGIVLIREAREDPHYWLSIRNVKIMASNMAEVLSRLDPAARDRYQTNLSRYLMKLDETDGAIRKLLEDSRGRKVVTFHDGWRYFARDYRLDVLATVEPSVGSEPTPKRLAHLTDLIAKHKIRVLFSESAVPQQVAGSIARDLNLKLYQLDPFGDGTRSFLDLMMANAQVVSEALRDG